LLLVISVASIMFRDVTVRCNGAATGSLFRPVVTALRVMDFEEHRRVRDERAVPDVGEEAHEPATPSAGGIPQSV
jgi:hypothetical protein